MKKHIVQDLSTLPWKIIITLGLFALVRPVIKIFGVAFDYVVPPIATIGITALIAVVWISVVVKLKVKRPVLVLAASGAVYGITSILIAVIIQLSIPELHDDEAKVPILLTAGLVATTAYNLLYGAVLGLIAKGIQKV